MQSTPVELPAARSGGRRGRPDGGAARSAGRGGRPDGRAARSERTRSAIVEALRALHHDGDLRPTAPRVAARAGVSLRTVWQHFSDLETLFVAAGRRDEQIARSFLQPIDAGLSLAQRIDQLVEQRASMYEEMAPVWRAARLQEPFSAQIRKNHDRLLALGRAQLEAVFDRELAGTGAGRRELLAALQVVTVWPAWESLRVDLKLTAAQAGNVMASTLVALLGKGPG